MNKPVIAIRIVSDVVCPWCYIGKRRLEKALDKLSNEYRFDIEYLPFELNPDIPEQGLDHKTYLSEKFGGEEQYEHLTARVTNIARTEGLDFNYAKQGKSPNTRKAHILIQLAKKENVQPAVVESFFKAYFTDGIDLSKTEALLEIASQAGLDIHEAAAALTNKRIAEEIVSMENALSNMGIRSVPFYILNNKYGLSGAQPAEKFIEALSAAGNELAKETEKTNSR